MNTNELTDLVAGVSALMERFERRMQQIELDLRNLSKQVPDQIRQTTDTEIRRLPDAVMGKVETSLQHSSSDYEKRLHDTAQHAQQAAQTLSGQLQRMESLHRQLVWKVAGITLGCLALLLLGGGWLSKHYYDEIRRNQVSAELLRAYNSADVTLCGEQLCANVDPGQDKYGDQGQYRPVRERH